jgi:TPR repeat protein
LLELYNGGRGVSKTIQTPDDYEDTVIGSTNKSSLLSNLQGLIKTPKAQLYAGKIFYEGKLVPRSLVSASAWVQLAVNQNLDEAIKMSNQIEMELSPSQKEAAKKLQGDLELRIRHTP